MELPELFIGIKKQIDISVLKKMGDSVQHRGSDDNGMQVGPG